MEYHLYDASIPNIQLIIPNHKRIKSQIDFSIKNDPVTIKKG